MRSCDDGYPSCRQAEAGGEWCKGECAASSVSTGELGDDRTDCDDDEQCLYCGGDGTDPYCDYLLPCPYCNGEQYP